jgi:putative membrane protein
VGPTTRRHQDLNLRRWVTTKPIESGEVREVVLAAWAHGDPGAWGLLFPLFWLAVVVGVVLLFRRRWGSYHVRSGRSVLAERYARGEISEEEYRTRAAVLKERW